MAQVSLSKIELGVLLRKIEFGDALLVLYIVVFVRQCFWVIGSNQVAWAMTATVSLLLWGLYLRAKNAPVERTPRLFWAMVALPLLLIYTLRVAYPDISFDVMNHRLIQSERALSGVQLWPGDFFPTIFPFNPSSDMLTGISRTILGYRAGTIINFLAFVWAGTILYKILRPLIERSAWRCLAVLFVLATEHALFEINNYMVDVLALPLLLEAMRLAIGYVESENRTRALLFAALLLGMSVALKLTNAAMVIPVLLVFAFNALKPLLKAKNFGVIALAAFLFILPLLPHAVYIYGETGNPVFPLYNKIFHSPFWSDINQYDGRWGPKGLSEMLLWPLVMVTKPERLSEMNIYSGRISLGFILAALILLLPRVRLNMRVLALGMLLGSIVWSMTSGYIRYALFLEALSGVLILYLAIYIYERAHAQSRSLRVALAALPCGLLAAQCALAGVYVRRTEWSTRPTYLDEPEAHRAEAGFILRDHSLTHFLTPEQRALFERVDAWVVSSLKTNGVEVLLRGDVPMLAINNLEYFEKRASRERFARSLEALRGKRIYTLAPPEDLDTALDFIKRRKLSAGEIKPVEIPFYSPQRQLQMMLIEVVLPKKREPAQKTVDAPEVTEATAPLDDEAFNAGISVADSPMTLRAGEKITLQVTVKNLSDFMWPARGQKDRRYSITIGDSWLDGANETLVNNLDGRAMLPRDLWPGEAIEVPLEITAPAKTGEYILEVDLLQEGVTFFKDKGSQALRIRAKVE
jgi:hypothetical protein